MTVLRDSKGRFVSARSGDKRDYINMMGPGKQRIDNAKKALKLLKENGIHGTELEKLARGDYVYEETDPEDIVNDALDRVMAETMEVEVYDYDEIVETLNSILR